MTVVPLRPRAQGCPAPTTSRTCTNTVPRRTSGPRPRASRCRGPGAPRTSRTTRCSTRWTTAKNYIVRSALDPDVLGGGEVRSVRVLLDPDQLDQFDKSFEKPVADGRHAPTGWLVRFDPARAELADAEIRVNGGLRAVESDASTLEVTADHTMVYPLRSAGDEGPRRRCSPSGASCTSASTGTTCGCTRHSSSPPTSRPDRSPAPRTRRATSARCSRARRPGPAPPPAPTRTPRTTPRPCAAPSRQAPSRGCEGPAPPARPLRRRRAAGGRPERPGRRNPPARWPRHSDRPPRHPVHRAPRSRPRPWAAAAGRP